MSTTEQTVPFATMKAVNGTGKARATLSGLSLQRRREHQALHQKTKREAKDEKFLAMKRAAYFRYAAKPENQVKIKARAKLKHLVRVGKLERGDCQKCGQSNAEAHHNDYSRPLDVLWLCHGCHMQEHFND